MFENKPSVYVTVTKYVLVGILLTVSILALGWGVWSYTYEQNLQEPPVIIDQPNTTARYSEAEWEEIKNSETGSSAPRYEEEEWNAIREAGIPPAEAEPAPASASYSEEEWRAIRSGG